MKNLMKNKINISIFFLITISVILIFLVYKPIIEKSKEVRCNYKVLDGKYENTNKNNDMINKIENQIQEVDSKIKVKKLSIPYNIKQKDVIALLEQFRLKSKLDFYHMQFNWGNQNEEKGKNLVKMYIDYEFSGNYDQFKKLLFVINESNKKITIEKLYMKKEYDAHIEGNMTMVLYGVKDAIY